MRSGSREHHNSAISYRQVFWLTPYLETPSHPIRIVDTSSLGFPIIFGADAYSGATAADSNRVPV